MMARKSIHMAYDSRRLSELLSFKLIINQVSVLFVVVVLENNFKIYIMHQYNYKYNTSCAFSCLSL